jgi:hypothetical protein
MTKLRTALIAAMAGTVMAAFSGMFDSAEAQQGMRSMAYAGNYNRTAYNRVGMNRGHFGHNRMGHFRGGYRGYGGIAAGIVGLAVMSQAVAAANAHREAMARIRYEQAARAIRKAPKQRPVVAGPKPPVITAQQKRDCAYVVKWRDMVEDAKRLLDEDRRLHKEHGRSALDIKFMEEEVQRRQRELDKAEERCRTGKA